MKVEPDLTGQRLGEFIFLGKLGRGGQGIAWLCDQPSLNRKVVIKVLFREGASAEARFLREAQLASQLDHLNAAHIYQYGREEFGLWIAMEYVAGLTLEEWLKQHRRGLPAQFVPFFMDLVDVVAAAHEKGIVHRDLKPGNIMVIERDGRLIPKLLDLGIAREGVHTPTVPDDGPAMLSSDEVPLDGPTAVDLSGMDTASQGRAVKRLTGIGLELGTRQYMPLEQWDNPGDVDHTADIYALGVVVFEVLVGHVPFKLVPSDPRPLEVKQMFDPRPSLGPDFSPEVDRVVQRALAKDPGDRYRRAKDFGAELCAALRGLPQGQIRSLAQVWRDSGRKPGLLLKSAELLKLDMDGDMHVGELEREFVVASRRAARRRVLLVRALVGVAVAFALGGVWQWGKLSTERAEEVGRLRTERAEEVGRLRTKQAQEIANLTIALSERERGRAGLLYGEPDAARHLANAYQRDHSRITAFMLARALQPLLAEQARLVSSFGRTWSATFSPDGSRILTSDDKNAQVWESQSHQLLFTLAHSDTVFQAVYSSDGANIITACGDGTVKIWDAESGALVRELRRKGSALRYYALAASPDGRLVAAIDFAGAIMHVWDVHSGDSLAELRNDGTAFPSIAFSADGKWLASSGGGETRVFDVRTWSQVAAIPAVRCMSWDPTGDRLLTGSVKGGVSLWTLPTGGRVHHLRDLGEAVTAVAYAPDGRLVVAASRDGTVQVWDAQSGELQSQGNYLHGAIRAIEFDRASKLTVAAGYSGAVAVLDARQGMPVSVLDGPRALVAAAHFDLKSQRVVGASWDGTTRIWNTEAPYRRWGSPVVANGCGVITELEPARRVLAVSCDNAPTRIWDGIRGQMLAELPSIVPSGSNFAWALPAVSTAGDRAAIARGTQLEVYEVPGGRSLYSVPHRAMVNAVAFASTGDDVVSGDVDGTVIVTRNASAQLMIRSSSAGIDAAAFLPDGRLMVADAERQFRVYDLRGLVLANLETSARVRTFRMSHDGRRVITLPRLVGTPAAPELWDLEQNRRVTRLDTDGQGYVWAARFASGGVIVTASADGAARVWVSATGELRQSYRGGSRFLADATLSADGSMVVGGDADGVLRFWDATSGVSLWNMPAHKSPLAGVYVEGDDIVTRGLSGDMARWTLPKPERVMDACKHNKLCATVFP